MLVGGGDADGGGAVAVVGGAGVGGDGGGVAGRGVIKGFGGFAAGGIRIGIIFNGIHNIVFWLKPYTTVEPRNIVHAIIFYWLAACSSGITFIRYTTARALIVYTRDQFIMCTHCITTRVPIVA